MCGMRDVVAQSERLIASDTNNFTEQPLTFSRCNSIPTMDTATSIDADAGSEHVFADEGLGEDE